MRLARTILLAAILAPSLWSAWSCKDEIQGPPLTEIVFPDSLISYSKQVQPLFDRGCGGQNSTCHGPETFADRQYSLDNYNNATHKVGIIVRGSPDASLLILTIEGKSPPKMPPDLVPGISANQIKGLRKWVAEGARGDN